MTDVGGELQLDRLNPDEGPGIGVHTHLVKPCRPVSERAIPEALYARVQGYLVDPRVEAIERVQDAL